MDSSSFPDQKEEEEGEEGEEEEGKDDRGQVQSDAVEMEDVDEKDSESEVWWPVAKILYMKKSQSSCPFSQNEDSRTGTGARSSDAIYGVPEDQLDQTQVHVSQYCTCLYQCIAKG